MRCLCVGNDEDFKGAVGGKLPSSGGIVQVLNTGGKKAQKDSSEDGGQLYKKDKSGKQSGKKGHWGGEGRNKRDEGGKHGGGGGSGAGGEKREKKKFRS